MSVVNGKKANTRRAPPRLLITTQLRKKDLKEAKKLYRFINVQSGHKRSAVLRALIRIGLEEVNSYDKAEVQFYSDF